MTRALLLLSLLCGGCLVVPAKKVTSKPAPHEFGAPTFATLLNIDLTARADEGSIHVHAIRRGECSRQVYAVTEVTTERKATLGGVGDPRAAFVGVLLAPVLIPTSALVTGLVLAADSPVTTKQTKLYGQQRYACSEEAEQLVVQATLPSGAVVTGVTDARGDVVLTVPATEPYTGAATIAARQAEPRQVSYALPRPAVTVTRDAVHECATRAGISGAIEVKLTINGRGHATRLWLSTGTPELNRCISQRVSGLRFPARTWDHTIKMPLWVAPAAASL